MSSQPDLLYTSVWGGDYVAFYKQALRYGLFDKMKVATTLAFGGYPHAIGKEVDVCVDNHCDGGSRPRRASSWRRSRQSSAKARSTTRGLAPVGVPAVRGWCGTDTSTIR